MKNGTIRWAPNDELRATMERAGRPLPDVLTNGHASLDRDLRFVHFPDAVTLTVNDRRPDLEKYGNRLWLTRLLPRSDDVSFRVP